MGKYRPSVVLLMWVCMWRALDSCLKGRGSVSQLQTCREMGYRCPNLVGCTHNGIPSITRYIQQRRSVGLARVIDIERKKKVSNDARHLEIACSGFRISNGTIRNWSYYFMLYRSHTGSRM